MRELAPGQAGPGRAGNTRVLSLSPRGTSGLHGSRWAGTAQLQLLWSLREATSETMLETPCMGRRAFKVARLVHEHKALASCPQMCLHNSAFKSQAMLHGLSLQDPKLRLVDNSHIPATK